MFEKFNNFLMKQQYGANDVDLIDTVQGIQLLR